MNKKDLQHIASIIDTKTILSYQQKISVLKNFNHDLSTFTNEKTRESAVNVILYPDGNDLYLILTQRNQYKGAHSGQISFPGGKREKEDTDLIETGNRETFEEIGLKMNRDDLIAELKTIYIPPSNFLVYPFLYLLDAKPIFTLDSREVKEIIEIPLSEIHVDNIKNKTVSASSNLNVDAPSYYVFEKVIWGATATIIAELHAIIDCYKDTFK